MRKFLFSLILFLLLFPSTAAAFEDTTDRYTTGWTDYYYNEDIVPYLMYRGTWTVQSIQDSLCSSNELLQITLTKSIASAHFYLVPRTSTDSIYYSFRSVGATNTNKGVCIIISSSDDTIVLGETVYINYAGDSAKIEVIKTGDNYDVYVNGSLHSTIINTHPEYTGEVKYCVGFILNEAGTQSLCFDDFSTSSIIGLSKCIYEDSENFSFTWSAQLMRNYQDDYSITLYSLTNQESSGKIKSWNISNTSEYGYVFDSRASVLGEYFGLYMLEMTRGDDILIDQYFYYDQLSNPQGFPELLLLVESDVNAEIRDEDLNGGEIAGGEAIYLYPSIRENGSYVIECKILETPYGIKTEFTKIYNTTVLTNTTIQYFGLSTQNYNVSLDGSPIGNTTGSDTFDTVLTWDSKDTHIIIFSPDLSLPGVWGYVKNSVTQEPIKSAILSISDYNNTRYLYTDSSGMYYLTQNMSIGTYNISASKTGYSTSIPFFVQTQEGATTRKDLFLDKISGEGTYYATHDVTFNVLEFWYSAIGLPGVQYTVTNEAEEEIKTGYTDSKGKFVVEDMDEGTRYKFELTYNGIIHTEYIEPSLTEYNIILNKEAEIVHTYYNNWLNLSYLENQGNITLFYDSNKTITAATLNIKAANGSTFYTNSKSTQAGTWNVNLSSGDYIINFNITASDGDTAFQSWAYSKAPNVPLFPSSYPTWLKNTLYVTIIIIFLLAFGKSKNDIACGAAAVLSSIGYYFGWLSCSFYFVVLIWIVALAAVLLHYRRTGALG